MPLTSITYPKATMKKPQEAAGTSPQAPTAGLGLEHEQIQPWTLKPEVQEHTNPQQTPDQTPHGHWQAVASQCFYSNSTVVIWLLSTGYSIPKWLSYFTNYFIYRHHCGQLTGSRRYQPPGWIPMAGIPYKQPAHVHATVLHPWPHWVDNLPKPSLTSTWTPLFTKPWISILHNKEQQTKHQPNQLSPPVKGFTGSWRRNKLGWSLLYSHLILIFYCFFSLLLHLRNFWMTLLECISFWISFWRTVG